MHGRLLVVVLLERLVALVLAEDNARGVPALRGLFRLDLRGGALVLLQGWKLRVRGRGGVRVSVGGGLTCRCRDVGVQAYRYYTQVRRYTGV